MNVSLVVQANYEHIQIGLAQDAKLIDSITHDKATASKYIIQYIDTLLAQNNFNLSNLTYITINQGPAPFTSLRVAITTVNGISFASSIPLVGVDGLETFLGEFQQTEYPYTVALLNAFNKDVYFGIQKGSSVLQCGWNNILVFLDVLKQQAGNKKILFLGGGVAMFMKEINDTFGNQAIILDPLVHYASLQQVATVASAQWHKKQNIQTYILPLYLKSLRYRVSIPA